MSPMKLKTRVALLGLGPAARRFAQSVQSRYEFVGAVDVRHFSQDLGYLLQGTPTGVLVTDRASRLPHADIAVVVEADFVDTDEVSHQARDGLILDVLECGITVVTI